MATFRTYDYRPGEKVARKDNPEIIYTYSHREDGKMVCYTRTGQIEHIEPSDLQRCSELRMKGS